MPRPRQIGDRVVEDVVQDAESPFVAREPERYGAIAAAHGAQAMGLGRATNAAICRLVGLEDLREEALGTWTVSNEFVLGSE
jgi:hypothetical protein